MSSLPAPPPPRYRQIAQHYLAAIESGTLVAGQRFPSVRQIMQTQNVSMSTAVQACHWLEDRGHVQARPRSGYYVQAAPRALVRLAADEPARLADTRAHFKGLPAFISQWLARTERMVLPINFAIAVGAPELYPTQALQRHASSVLRQQPQVLTRMARRYGHPDFTQVLARRAVAQGLALAPHEIIVTSGCTEAINLALRAVCERGDAVAVESPTFYGILQIVEALGLVPVELPTSATTGLSIDALEMALEQRAPAIRAVLVMPTVHNPLGCTMPDAHKAALVALCARHRVPLIEDSIYAALDAEQALTRPLKAWDTDGAVIHCSSLNKILAPGLRLGWMAAGRWHARAEMLKYTQTRFPEELGQLIAARYLGSGAFDRHLRQLQTVLRTRRQQMADAIGHHFGQHFGPGAVRLHMPTGGLLLWLELPAGISATRLAEAALAEGIRTAPGPMFSSQARFDRFMRLSCGAVSAPQIDHGIAALARLAATALQARRGRENP